MSSRDEIKSKIEELNKKLKVSKNQSTRLDIMGQINNLNKQLLVMNTTTKKNNIAPVENKKPTIVEEKKNDINRGKVVEVEPEIVKNNLEPVKEEKKYDNKNNQNNQKK